MLRYNSSRCIYKPTLLWNSFIGQEEPQKMASSTFTFSDWEGPSGAAWVRITASHVKYNGDLPCFSFRPIVNNHAKEKADIYLDSSSTVCPSHYTLLFRRCFKLVSPSTMWTEVFSFTPFLFAFLPLHLPNAMSAMPLWQPAVSRVLKPTPYQPRSPEWCRWKK